MPKLSVIMATNNSVRTVEAAIDSVLCQSENDLELIIVDNCSTDGTLQEIDQKNDPRILLISEPDRGIYDAWNKGLKISSGKWVSFIGSDDFYASSDTLENLLKVANISADISVVSGKIEFIDSMGQSTGEFYGEPWVWKRIRNQHSIAHPGAIFSCELFHKFGFFSTDYKIAGDYEFTVRLGSKLKAAFVPITVAFMGREGVSSKYRWLSLREAVIVQFRAPHIGNLRATKNFFLGACLLLLRVLGICK